MIEISKDVREMLEKIVESTNVKQISQLDDPTFPEGVELRKLKKDDELK